MTYPRVVTIRFDKYTVNRCNWVQTSANSAVDTDVELPETQSRVICSLEVVT